MSPWLRDELRIDVGPDRVGLGRVGKRLTPRGVRAVVRAEAECRLDPVPDRWSWSGAMKGLETLLGEHAALLALPATAVLSSHFVRYAIVPWSDTLSDAGEEDAYARLCFRRIYGEPAQAWAVRISPDRPGSPRLASAVDSGLIDALRTVLAGAGARLHSIQPGLMADYNACRSCMGTRDAWFATLEPGALCLLLRRRGHLARVRGTRVGGAWREELPVLLDREACLAEIPSDIRDVYLWAPGTDDAAAPLHDGWRIHVLAPAPAVRPGKQA